ASPGAVGRRSDGKNKDDAKGGGERIWAPEGPSGPLSDCESDAFNRARPPLRTNPGHGKSSRQLTPPRDRTQVYPTGPETESHVWQRPGESLPQPAWGRTGRRRSPGLVKE